MTAIAYTVSATLPTAELARQYIAWLADGHIQAVCAGGAQTAQILILDTPKSEPARVEVRYHFPDRQKLDAYLQHHAPRLRAEGLALFGPATGVTFARSTALLAHQHPVR